MARVETVTVLFTDLVDSTGRRVRAGEEEAERLRVHHDRLVRAAVVANGGKIAKHTGDGVMATFTGASEAIAAAVAVQQSIDADNRGSEQSPASLRIGISVGDVSVEDGDCFGLPVVEAQRLEASADGGQILASSLVRALARGRGGYEFRSVGALTLKGLDGPLDADEVLWSPLPFENESEQLPPAVRDRGGFGFAGRTKEQEILTGAWHSVATGATRLVFVAGEPGIGKTRIASELARTVADEGGVVLAGRSDELVGVPYQPFVESLRWQLTLPDGPDALGPAPGELTRLVPDLRDVVADLPEELDSTPDAERLRLFEGVRGWLAAVAADDGALLVLDDVHWSDLGTLLLLRHVVAIDPVPKLMVVATYRDTDLDRTHPLASMLADLRRRSDVTRIALEGLEAAEVTDLLTLAAGHDLDDAAKNLATNLREETGGNPFFVGEVLRHLAETGAIEQRDGRWTAGPGGEDVPLPEGIRDVIGRRLSALPDETQRVLGNAAVIGVGFDLRVLGRVSGGAEDDVLDALEPALAAGLVTETGVERYRFSHALVPSALRQELSTTRRARLHRGIAEALLDIHAHDLDAVVADLAFHFGEAGAAIPSDQAITFALRAADLAFARPAPDEAARWYRHALELLDGRDPVTEAEVLSKLAVAELEGGAEDALETQLRAARAAEAVGNVSLMAETLCHNRRTAFNVGSVQGVNTEKIELLERALAATSERDIVMQGRLTADLSLETVFTGDFARRDALVARAYQLSADIDDPYHRYRIRSMASRAEGYAGRRRARIEAELARVAEAYDWARATGARDMELSALLQFFYVSLVLGDGEARGRRLDEFDELLAAYPHPLSVDGSYILKMTQALVDGEIARAEALADDLERRMLAHGISEGATYAASGRLEAARERTGLGPLVDLIRATPGAEAERGRPGVLRGLTALALAEGGRLDEARVLIDEVGGNGFRDVVDDAALPVTESTWAETAALVGHRDACDALLEILRPRADLHQVTGGWYLGSTTRYLALLAAALGRDEEAEAWFGDAVAEHERIKSPPWSARTRLDWAEFRLGLGDPDRARDLARQALDDIGALELDASRARAERIMTSR